MEDLIATRTTDTQPVLVAGHRGMMALFPENTLLSFQEAIAAGVDMLEFDLNLTRDRELVVIHDNTVDRTTDGTGPVRELTLDQIKSLDAGGKFSAAHAGLKIPTLRELCALVKPCGQLLLNVEIKERTRETVDLTVVLLQEYDLLGRCVFACFDGAILRYLHDEYHLRTQGFPGEYMDNFTPDLYGKMYAAGIAMRPFPSKPQMTTLSPEATARFAGMGIKPWCFCPDDENAVKNAIHCGARLMTCNNPLPALRFLGKR